MRGSLAGTPRAGDSVGPRRDVTHSTGTARVIVVPGLAVHAYAELPVQHLCDNGYDASLCSRRPGAVWNMILNATVASWQQILTATVLRLMSWSVCLLALR